MSNIQILGNFPHTVGNLDDRPNLNAQQMKAAFEKDVMTLWAKLAECIPHINEILPASRLVDVVSQSSTDSGVPTAKAVYDAIAAASLGGNAQQIIDDWLDAHPEATTTVQDGSITNAKLSTSFVTPGVAAAYVPGKFYSANSYVFENGVLYTNSEDVSDNVWTAGHWMVANIGEYAAFVKNAFGQIGERVKLYLPKTVIPADNIICAYPVNIKHSEYRKVLSIKDSGEGGYYSFGLYNSGTLVWGSGPVESGEGLVWVSAGSTKQITIPTNVDADLFKCRNRNARTGTIVAIDSYGENYTDHVKYQSVINYFRRFGMEPDVYEVAAVNGAYRDVSSKTLTIPTGETGNGSYFGMSFLHSRIKKFSYSLQEGVFWVGFRCSDPMENLNPVFWSPRDSFVIDSNLICVVNNTYIYGIRFSFPSSLLDTGSEVFYCQFGNSDAVSSDITIQLVSATAEWDGYDQKTLGIIPRETIITVGIGKQFTSLRTALEYAAGIASKTSRVVVQFYGNGTEYDLMDDISASDLTSSATFKGLVVPAYCKLLGMGSREQNKISLTLPAGTDANAAFRISTVNLVENAELENLWFYGKGCRYACHDDDQSYNPEWHLKTIKNCRFTSDHTNQHRAYGAGYRSGVNWRFENCIFENVNGEATEFGNAAFSAHNNNAMQKSASIVFVNCQASGGHAFGFESLNLTSGQDYPNAKTNISFYGCKGVALMWDRPVLAGLPSSIADLEVCITGFGNNFDNNGVGVYHDGHYYNERFAQLLTLWGKITEGL